MKCDKDVDCYGKPEWRVSFTNDFFGDKQKTVKLNYCDRCYNLVNPDHKRFLIQDVDDIKRLGILKDMRDRGYPVGDVEFDHAILDFVKFRVVLKFRRLHH